MRPAIDQVFVRAIQYSDGQLEDVEILVNGADSDGPLNSDQSRELASALLQAAAEVDEWEQQFVMPEGLAR